MRPWIIWTIFAFCLTVGLTIMGWLSATTLNLEARARRTENYEQVVRLALLRMESSIQLVLAYENMRPFYAYNENYDPNSYLTSKARADACRVPLRFNRTPGVKLYFQVDPEGHLTSPDVSPTEASEEVYLKYFEELRDLVDPVFWEELCPLTPATALVMAFDDFVHRNPGSGPGQAGTAPHPREDPKNFQLPNSKLQRQLMDNTLPATEDVQQNLMSAAWVEEQLLLARRVSIGGLEYFQGCWLDWDAFKKSLLKDVRDLLPSADLEPVLTKSDADEDPHNCLVSLPARLVPGALPERVVAGLTPLESALYLAWACIALTAVAVGVVLHGVLTLSERRGAFVSAVTHELRTPLTTFRMYTEMLAENMIGEDKRRRYMERLRTEADRLGHLVENVLAYARLEQGRHRGRLEPMPVGAILDHARERLAQRAEQAGMTVVFEADGQSGIQVRTDLAATEQVLFNLVDNACKYAAGASDKRIHVEAVAGNGTAGLRVRDHGPGLSRDVQRRLFQPFSKSEIDAANSAPGVGLGLSLCRRLARDLGGDLIHEPQDHGTAFVLHLPREGG